MVTSLTLLREGCRARCDVTSIAQAALVGLVHMVYLPPFTPFFVTYLVVRRTILSANGHPIRSSRNHQMGW